MAGLIPGEVWLDGATLAVSLFNAIVLLWLGLAILLNAEKRAWGMWLAAGGVLMGALFFVSHSAILGAGGDLAGQGPDFWWHAGWLPVLLAPFAWYVVTLWYSGFWSGAAVPVRRQLPGLLATTALGLVLVDMLLFAKPLPSFEQVLRLDLSGGLSVAGFPSLFGLFPLFILLTTGLALDALRYPAPSAQAPGDLARHRALPWLQATGAVLLVVALLVSGVMLWAGWTARPGLPHDPLPAAAPVLAWLDLGISSLIAAAILFLGQAVVSYEIFTGKTLPRRGFLRQWRNVVVLAAGYGVVVSGSLALGLRPIYGLLLSAGLMTLFLALYNQRSFIERERMMAQLRPFVASQQLYEHLLEPSGWPGMDGREPFRALCDEVLGARLAYLLPLGPYTSLVDPPLAYPDDLPGRLPSPAEIAARLNSSEAMSIPLDPACSDGFAWLVPLWSQRGLIGALLLGEKRDGGLYTEEEIELARASGERLLDAQASAEMARRLIVLQRQRLAESQVADGQTRHILHDEVLPGLHAALLRLSDEYNTSTHADSLARLSDIHRQIADLLHAMPAPAAPRMARIGLTQALREAVEAELEHSFDGLTWEIEPQAECEARRLPQLAAAVLFYAAREAIRNAARHARNIDSDAPLRVHVAVVWQKGLEIRVEDNGIGMPAEAGMQATGQGLDLHATMMAIVGGALSIESEPGRFTRVQLTLPEQAFRDLIVFSEHRVNGSLGTADGTKPDSPNWGDEAENRAER